MIFQSKVMIVYHTHHITYIVVLLFIHKPNCMLLNVLTPVAIPKTNDSVEVSRNDPCENRNTGVIFLWFSTGFNSLFIFDL